MLFADSNGSRRALEKRDSPPKLKSVNGEMTTAPAGNGSPSSLSAIRVDNVSPPPAESPAITMLFGSVPRSRRWRYAARQSSSPAGNGCSGASR